MPVIPVINYLKKKAKQQCQRKKGYIWEQPWSSAMWDHLQENLGHADRTDQCRFGAQDEVGNPILKPTGLQGDLALKHCVKRCAGHLGQKHGWLQGAVQGVNRTTAAAVYPESLGKASVKDIKRFISNKSTVYNDYYKCERCALGRAATDEPEGGNPRERKKAEKEQKEQDDLFSTSFARSP